MKIFLVSTYISMYLKNMYFSLTGYITVGYYCFQWGDATAIYVLRVTIQLMTVDYILWACFMVL